MIKRYSDERITDIWSLQAKYGLWQNTELAVIKARAEQGKVPAGMYGEIETSLKANGINSTYIDEREAIIHHDLNAFLEERMRFLSPALGAHFHCKMTSYDTEEPAFAIMLKNSCEIVLEDAQKLVTGIKELALKYRHTPMNGRTHGQEAEMMSFGKRCLTWGVELSIAACALNESMIMLKFSKLSGAIGTNSGIEPELEEAALHILGLEPLVGATQIMPRVLYSPIASSLADLVSVMNKIATDIRLGARSGRPLWHEPFSKKQKGSSAMPHKKNTILTENIGGMARMARQYAAGLKENIETWEERDIAQSSIERVFWPDLFHVTIRAIKNLTKVMAGLVVYPDTMLIEIVESRGCYASNAAKELLVELGQPFGLEREAAYRIVQLACFNVFEPLDYAENLRRSPAISLEEADAQIKAEWRNLPDHPSIEQVIMNGKLRTNPQLDAGSEVIQTWNDLLLLKIFGPDNTDARKKWSDIFRPSHILANEAHLFEAALRT